MTARMRFVRNLTEWGVFLVGIVVGLCAAMLGAAAMTYLLHGPHSVDAIRRGHFRHAAAPAAFVHAGS